ncbi:MAG: L-threonylcarbamoyladenylate synthase [SAR324 cluster bacterium]|nr:L-threonylcarbamoyladenylate synthase [SAR324 cluster bacterium]
MNSKCAGEQPQSYRTAENEVDDKPAGETILVGDKAHLVGFPFTKAAERQVSTALSNKQVLAFPTETFYGLGGNAFSTSVVDRVYRIKERPRTKPLLVLITPQWLPRLCKWSDSRINDLIDEYWPGPLTLILAANPELPEHLQNTAGTLAVRYTSSPVAQRLIELGDCPLIGTSANLTGMPECSTVKQVAEQLKNKLDLIIDGGNLPAIQPSTIVNCTSKKIKILRHGAITLTELNRICEVG